MLPIRNNQSILSRLLLPFLLTLLIPGLPLGAMGQYAEGWTIVRLVKLESGGLFFTSYEGVIQMASYDESESCDEKKDNCFTPKLKTIDCSVDKDSKDAIRFMNLNIGREMLVKYKVHRIHPVTLGSNFEILEAHAIKEKPEAGFPLKKVVKQSGSKRNFSLYGKVLRLERSGTILKTYEGLYYDRTKDKVHPFSVTDNEMAKYIWQTMHFKQEHYIGVSVAIFTTVRLSQFDIFEINYLERAGSNLAN